MKSLACLLLMVSLSAGAQDCPPDDPAKRDTAAQVAYVLQWGPNYDIRGPYTVAGGVESRPDIWPDWLRRYPDH